MADTDELGRMGGALTRLHHEFDEKRFLLLPDVESGYAWWLAKEMVNPDAVVLVGELDGRIVGYTYGSLQERDWNALLDTCAGLHDLWVDQPARKSGLGRALLEAIIAAFTALGAPRIVLLSATPNVGAQRLFAKLGWRNTMVEMTRETSEP